jgi:creatinine amidohydrolase
MSEGKSMRLQLSTWQEVETYLETSRGIIVPIGSTEQHGPIGLIGTDSLCPEIIADVVSAEIGVMVGPTISVGMAQHHLAFPGSVALRPTTLIAVIKDYVLSLGRNGFERFYFLNGHGGNIMTIGAAFSEIHAERSFERDSKRPTLRCKNANWFGFPDVSRLCESLFKGRDGSHATASEISVTQYAYPDSIKSADMERAKAPPRGFYDAEDYRALFPDGRIGADSFLATPEAGKQLIDASARSVKNDYQNFMQQA